MLDDFGQGVVYAIGDYVGVPISLTSCSSNEVESPAQKPNSNERQTITGELVSSQRSST